MMGKGGLSDMMGKAKDRPSEPPAEEMREGPDAMRDLGEALADKDWTAAWTAFQTACKLCEGDGEGYEDDTAEE